MKAVLIFFNIISQAAINFHNSSGSPFLVTAHLEDLIPDIHIKGNSKHQWN